MRGTENYVFLGAMPTWNGTQKNGVIFCHGSGGTAFQTLDEANHRKSMYGLGQFSTVQSADWGLQAWGNDTAISLIDAGIDEFKNNWGVEGKVGLVGVSMGGCNVLNYAVRNPDKVACVAGILALTDLGKIYDDNVSGVAGEINTAYGGSFDASDRAMHSPISFVNEIPEDMPIKLWTAPDDTIVVPSTHTAFIAARPQTEQKVLGSGYGHSAWNVGIAADEVTEWVRRKMVGGF